MQNNVYLFFGIFISAICQSFVLNRVIVTFHNKTQQQASHDGQERWASVARSRFGGISFYLVFMVHALVLGAFYKDSLSVPFMGIILASTIGFVVGLLDDIYNTIPMLKFFGQLLCAIILIISGFVINCSSNEILNYAISTIWIVGMMNSINMLDNMDAIVAVMSKIAIIAILGITVWFSAETSPINTGILVAVLGALLGFLCFNWSPAKLFMGDTGSQFLGVFLAAFSIIYLWNFRQPSGEILDLNQFVAPMLVFIIPLIDTITVTFRRIARKQSPFVGGRDHTTHHLVYWGLSERQTVVFLAAVAIIATGIFGWLATHLNNWNINQTWASFAFFGGVFLCIQYVYELGKIKSKIQSKQKAKNQSKDILQHSTVDDSIKKGLELV